MTGVLCINVGSSTIKGAYFDEHGNELGRSTIESSDEHWTCLNEIVKVLGVESPNTIIHRVVHGGPSHNGPADVSDALLLELRTFVPLAPLHMPPALAMIRVAKERFPNSRHMACFDTAFHRTIPRVRRRYPLSTALTGSVVQRYGFHGLSCEYVVSQLNSRQLRRCVVAHLGSGCSLTALQDGRSADSTMGFSPTGGVLMGTRPGDLDPGLVLYLINQGHDIDSLTNSLNHESGLMALAGSADMRIVLEREHHDDDAAQAVELFCYRIAQQVGAYAVTLGGLDTLVFTGGIGEHQSEIRQRIATALPFLAPFETVVVEADEELTMVRQVLGT